MILLVNLLHSLEKIGQYVVCYEERSFETLVIAQSCIILLLMIVDFEACRVIYLNILLMQCAN